MGADPEVFARLTEQLTRARDRQVVDELLDRWLDFGHRATEWDAEQWGFDPNRWMTAERAAMARLHGCGPRPRWPRARPSHT